MKQSILVATAIALMLSGCGDKDESTSQDGEATSMLEKARDMGMDMKDKATEAGSNAVDATKDAASTAMDATKDAASSAMETVEDKVESATESVKDMGADLMDKAKEKTDAAMGSVAGMTGMADTAAPEASDASDASATMDADQLAMGKKIFSGNCFACHGTGVAGAPKLGDAAAWAPRIKQGMNTLVEHSLVGFKGNTGYMPPKGGFTTLSDAEVSAAVAYMVDQVN